MKTKMKVLVAAITMAAAVQANAAISDDSFGSTGPTTGTGAGEMFLSVIDRGGSAPESYVLDLGITSSAFRANPNSFLGTTFAADSNLNSLFSNQASNGGSIFWNLAAADNRGQSGDYENFGYLTTSAASLTPANAVVGNNALNTIANSMGRMSFYVNAVNSAAGANNSVLVGPTNPNAFYDGVNWGNDWDLQGHGSETALGNSMGFYFIGLDYPNDPNGETARVDAFSGVWTLAANGTLTYDLAGGPAPVPLPPALWLLGSALIGMVGVARRRNSAEMMA